MFYKLAQLILTPGKKSNTVGEVYVAQPDIEKENLAGKLFLIIEIESNNSNNLKLINFLIENLSNNYYQNEKMFLRERLKSIKIEIIFESALAKTNKDLAEFLKAEKIDLNFNEINATIGIIFENNVHFSSLGKNRALLIYKEKKAPVPISLNKNKKRLFIAKLSAEAENNYKIIDIISRTKTNERRDITTSENLFTNIINGVIPRGGYIIFSNETIPEYLSAKQLLEIITTLPPIGAIEQIKNNLSRINSYVTFLAVLIKNTVGPFAEETIKIAPPKTTQESVRNLNSVAEKTEKFLTPRGYVNFKKWFAYFKKSPFSFNFASLLKSRGAASQTFIKDKIFFKKKPSFLKFNLLLTKLQNFIVFLIKLIPYLIKAAIKINYLQLAAKIKNNTINWFKNSWAWFKSLNVKNKTLLIIITLSFLLLALNLIFVKIKNNNALVDNNFISLVQSIEQKENQLEASLLYKNEEGARQLIGEIQALIGSLPVKTDEQKQKKSELSAKLDSQSEKIKHIVKVENIKEISNLNELRSGANPDNISLLISKNKIYSADNANKAIYSIDISKNIATEINTASATISGLKFAAKDKNENIYFINGSDVLFMNKNEELKNLPLTSAVSAQNAAALASFNNMLYLADSSSGQIYRYKIQSSKLSVPSPWLNSPADLNKLASFGIDGSIYLLFNDGRLAKYLTGSEESFKLDAIIPPLENPDKIVVSQDLDRIYILEKSKNRIAVFDKNGKFISQYLADNLTRLKDFALNEKTKTIYLLNNTFVYSGKIK